MDHGGRRGSAAKMTSLDLSNAGSRRHPAICAAPNEIALPPSSAPSVADNTARVGETEAAGAVVVIASHGGIYAAYLAAKLGAAAAIFNDAAVGRDRAGIAGLDHLQEL